ncbi:hypothetical protein LCGC14_0839850 [marine sediment metagenome]|uniref:Putative regulatory protein FmdB zinc ribbon domain-containing protein n=1 Tax=marine sediment metagenome TaxID=412755 RepID=A0A0F9RY54_9ZZZZ
MPLYEYVCPQCRNRFESLQNTNLRHSALCPKCNSKTNLIPSHFSFKFFNPFTKDGEGFTTKHVSMGELTEMNKECRDR